MCVQRLRCEAGSRLVQLDSLTRRNRTLTRLFQGAMKARLLASARECGQRWDDVNAKLESITGRLKVRDPHKNYNNITSLIIIFILKQRRRRRILWMSFPVGWFASPSFSLSCSSQSGRSLRQRGRSLLSGWLTSTSVWLRWITWQETPAKSCDVSRCVSYRAKHVLQCFYFLYI